MKLHAQKNEKTCVRGFQTRSDINWNVQSQKLARGINVRIYEVEELYYMYLFSENKGSDQLL